MSTPDDSHFDPDDPRLTAYALGELPDPADRVHVEALLTASPEARAELADIRALTAVLTAEYEQDRVAATPVPTNIVWLPAPRRAWNRPLLAAAAVVLLSGLAFFMIPTYRSSQVGSRRSPSVVFSTSQALQPPASGSVKSLSSQGKLALSGASRLTNEPTGKNTVQVPAPGAPTPPPADLSSTPLLAQVQPPAILPVQRALAASAPANAKRADAPMVESGPGRTRLVQRPQLFADASKDTDSAIEKDQTATAAPVLGGLPAASKAAPGDTAKYGFSEEPRAQRRPDNAFNTAAYDHITETPFLTAKDNPLSTFSVDVDTASYSIVRRFIEGGSLPPADAVRIEEMLNYFPYDYAPPTPGDERPFAIHLESASCPWNPDHRLVRVALKGREIAQDKRPPSNLVFLIDVSGSMVPPERLPLIKESFRLLVERLTDNDHVAIVVYAGHSGLVLPSTNGAHKDTILHALNRLEAGGSTNGAAGIQLAYKVAQANFIKDGTNRVILATDGDFNVGTTSQGELVRLIEKERKSGVFLTCLGVGTDNLKDSTMQKLADHGNGHYAYLDSLDEGRKVLVEQLSGTLVTIAKDVKIQVEFNPAAVDSYRLIGYEKRLLRKEDFNDDRVDAGEIGAGHSVTALYEVVPTGQSDAGSAPAVDALKYQPAADARPTRAAAQPADAREMLTVKIRHKAPDSDVSERSYEAAFVDHHTGSDYANATPDFKFAAAVATFGLALRDSPYKGSATLGAAVELAREGKGADAGGYRADFIELARRAQALSSNR